MQTSTIYTLDNKISNWMVVTISTVKIKINTDFFSPKKKITKDQKVYIPAT